MSKCLKLIKRFSEDIDITVNSGIKPTESRRRHLKENILQVIDGLGMELSNPDEIRSRRDFNRYVVDFPTVFRSNAIKSSLVIETMAHIRAYPNEVRQASAMVYDFLVEAGHDDIIKEFELEPFDVRVQSAERTFVDKVFAICDYYLAGNLREHSRHIYDLYKLLGVVSLDGKMKDLVNMTRDERCVHRVCLSAQDGVDINKLLETIILEETYKDDYENVTSSLLFEEVDYSTAIKAIEQIRNSGIF